MLNGSVSASKCWSGKTDAMGGEMQGGRSDGHFEIPSCNFLKDEYTLFEA